MARSVVSLIRPNGAPSLSRATVMALSIITRRLAQAGLGAWIKPKPEQRRIAQLARDGQDGHRRMRVEIRLDHQCGSGLPIIPR